MEPPRSACSESGRIVLTLTNISCSNLPRGESSNAKSAWEIKSPLTVLKIDPTTYTTNVAHAYS